MFIFSNFSPKTELLSLFVLSLVLILNFSISDTRSSGSVAKSNSTLLLKHDCVSASLYSSISMPVTHCVSTNLLRIYWVRVSVENMFFCMLSYSQLIYFRKTVSRKLTYFHLSLIISSFLDFKLYICGKTCEFDKYSKCGWAYIDLNTFNLSFKCTARLSNAKNSNIAFFLLLNFCMRVCSMLFFVFSNFSNLYVFYWLKNLYAF